MEEQQKMSARIIFLYASRAGLDGWVDLIRFGYVAKINAHVTHRGATAGPPCGRYIELHSYLFILVFVQKKLSMGAVTWRPNSVPAQFDGLYAPMSLKGPGAFIPGFQTSLQHLSFLDVFVTYYIVLITYLHLT